MLLRENFPRGSEMREGLKTWHYMLGLTVLAAALLRVALRVFVWKTPPITPPPQQWQMWLAGSAHIALYGLMILMPIAGWLILSAEGEPIPLWGFSLPPLVAPDKALAEQIKDVHETIGTVGYFLIGLHASAALYHHYVVRDDTVKRMLPGGN
jgi:cytochrome b561